MIRKRGKDKKKETFKKYGKYTPRSTRIKESTKTSSFATTNSDKTPSNDRKDR